MNSGIGRRRAQPRQQRHRATSIVCAAIIAATGFIAWQSRAAGAQPKAALVWRPDSATPRLQWARVRGLPPLSVSSFAVTGGRLYLADRVGSRVLELSPLAAGDWRVDSAIADRPAIQTPVSIAATPDGDLLVYDFNHDVHLLRRAGGRIESYQASVPCGLTEGQLTVAQPGTLLLAGRCAAGTGDTIAAVLLASADGGRHFAAMMALPLFGRDGSWGSVLYAKRFVLAAGDSVMFGTGVTGCVHILRAAAPDPSRRDCTLGSRRYTAREPADFADVRAVRVSSGMTHGNATAWPDPLPAFLDRVLTDKGIAVMRLVSGDSIQLELWNPTAPTPLLVAPVNGFRGCSDTDCLWIRNTGVETLVRLVHVPDLLQQECTARYSDTALYEESTKSRLAPADSASDSAYERRDSGRIEYIRTGSRLVASYERAAVGNGGRGATPPRITYAFAEGACGTGTARVQTPGIDDGTDLPYHLDALLIAPPSTSPLSPGQSWADTIKRSDSLALGVRTAVLIRRFRVTADTVVAAERAMRLSLETHGTVLTQEQIQGNPMTVLISSSGHGTVLLSRSSRVMLERSDSTELRLIATAGSATMPERRVQSIRTLGLLRP